MPDKEYCPKDLHSKVTGRDRTCTKLKCCGEVEVLDLNQSYLLSCPFYVVFTRLGTLRSLPVLKWDYEMPYKKW